jgi:hypothetical protein
MKTSPKARGTRWESRVRDLARDFFGLLSARYEEGGSSDAGDVWINQPITAQTEKDMLYPMVALAWKRLVRAEEHHQRRQADGEGEVVVLRLRDFLALVRSANMDPTFEGMPVVVECKAAQQINTTRILGKAIDKVDAYRLRVRRDL